jgi:hypothetical protein
MLAPLGFYLLMMLIACTTILVICWVDDTIRAETKAGRSRPANFGSPVHHHGRKSHVRISAPVVREKTAASAAATSGAQLLDRPPDGFFDGGRKWRVDSTAFPVSKTVILGVRPISKFFRA